MMSDAYFGYERVAQYLKIDQCCTPYKQTKKKKGGYCDIKKAFDRIQYSFMV